ncbi:phosphoribosylglycinamide formyltransferase [Conexibacter sp. S30A1]|uniref:phosphoribosylglycinamide formyltransferase n=1 Tax=Conexibacter sp. S30A1 TaxID=2937800 RepID=UPI00200CF37B|nr:phosphoribosylglycinamide formyltransferase [Conexibacter sp. S30A1]
MAVLASGVGTNLQALIDQVHGRDGVRIVAVASDNPEAQALERAAAAEIPTAVFGRQDFRGDRRARDRAMAGWLREQGAQLVVMAGYMQLVCEEFLDRFPDAVINIHPSLLPAFAGLDAVGQALAYGVKLFGVTVHYADPGADSGPVIMQRAVSLPDAREPADVVPHLQALEHQMLPEVVRLFARGAVRIASTHPRRVLVGPLAVLPER